MVYRPKTIGETIDINGCNGDLENYRFFTMVAITVQTRRCTTVRNSDDHAIPLR